MAKEMCFVVEYVERWSLTIVRRVCRKLRQNVYSERGYLGAESGKAVRLSEIVRGTIYFVNNKRMQGLLWVFVH